MEKQYCVLEDTGSSRIVRAASPQLAIAESDSSGIRAEDIHWMAEVGKGAKFQWKDVVTRWWFVEEACAVCQRQWHTVISCWGKQETVAANSIEDAIRRSEDGPGAGAILIRDSGCNARGEWVKLIEQGTECWWIAGPGAPAAPPAVRDGTIQQLQEAYDDLQEQYDALQRERDKMKDWIDGMAKHMHRIGYTKEGKQIVVPPQQGDGQ